MVCTLPAFAAEATDVSHSSVDEILADYHSRVNELMASEKKGTVSTLSLRTANTVKQIEQQTVERLTDAGYEAYSVTHENFSDIEDVLCADFSEIGLLEGGSYIVVVESEDTLVSTSDDDEVGTAGDPYYYVYNGVVYKLRYLTITAADVPSYAMTSEPVNLVNSNNTTVLENVLDTLISVWGSTVICKSFGTILSLLGISTSAFSTNHYTSLYFTAASSWVKKYAQVWDESLQGWAFASCVQYVDMNASIDGYYFNSTLGEYVDVDQTVYDGKLYSEHYRDSQWRKEQSVIGYLNNMICYDVVYAEYYYGNRLLVRHASHTF